MTAVTGRHRRKARNSAWILASVAIVMVLVAVGAVFAPTTGKGTVPNQTAYRGIPLIHPTHVGAAAAGTPAPSPSPTTPTLAQPKPTPPPPIAAPAPVTVTPAPPPPTYTPPPPSPPPPPPPSPTPDPGSDLPPVVALQPPLPGVATGDVPAWNRMTQSHAQLVVRWVSMARPLAPTFLHGAMRTADGGTPVIEIMPTAPGQPSVTLADITAGNRDGWLTAFRDQVQALHRPVIVSFAPEANGTWYAWSREGPAAFAAAWRHAHAVIGGTDHWVTWMWQMSAHNAGDPATVDFRAYWPGGDVVNWAGLDGYDYLPSDYFEHRFATSLREVQAFWGGPIIIAETAVSPSTGHIAKGITDLFNGVARWGLLGLIYLNLQPNGGGFYHPDFRIDHHPAALAAYTAAVSGQW